MLISAFHKKKAQNRRQKVFSRGGLYVCAEEPDIEKLTKFPLIYSVAEPALARC